MIGFVLAAALIGTAPAPDGAAPIPVSVTRVSAEQLGGAALSGPAPVDIRSTGKRIGALIYRGYGIDIRSGDPRFDGIVMGRSQNFRHPCGEYAFGPSGWHAYDDTSKQRFFRCERNFGPDKLPPGSLAAAAKGVLPHLDGARLGPTWPVNIRGRSYFAGIMYPNRRTGESLIVAFADRPGSVPAILLARLDMVVQGFSITPGMHDPHFYLNLGGRSPTGTMRSVVLELRGPEADRIGRQLGTGRAD